ncbi:MAG TPA: hypothetical protein VHB54_07670, partial [Mucilaginibacter sp.]|nr:hypothetical protein [Mucilaginibacter sp.]
IIGGEPDADETGTWSYDKSKGAISMSTKGKSHKEIIFLTKDQFATFADDPVSDPNHPNRVSLKAKVYFKVKQLK